MEIANNRKINIYGVTFYGFSDIKKYALSGEPKDGVYVGEDSERYPCFDSSDYEYENRFYWNFVFARSQEELDQKLRRLQSMGHGGNYRKFTDELSPMIYFQGDTYYPLEVTVCGDIVLL